MAALVASFALAVPAAASGGLSCSGDGAKLDIATGRLVVLRVLDAYVEVGDKAFSTGPHRGPGTKFIVGQAFAEDGRMMIDFTDPNVEAIIVGIRLTLGSDDRFTGTVTAGDVTVDVDCLAG